MGRYEESESYAYKTLSIVPVHSCETHIENWTQPGMILGA